MANPELPPGQGWMASSPLEVQFQNKFLVVSGLQWLIIVSSTSRPASPPARLGSASSVFSVLALTVVEGVVVVVVGVVVLLVVVVILAVVEGGSLLGSGVAERSSSQGGLGLGVVVEAGSLTHVK